MLRDLLFANRDQILARTRLRCVSRGMTIAASAHYGLPVFLTQLHAVLGEVAFRDLVAHPEIEASGGVHGGDLFDHGATMAQVVQDYGDLFHVITGLAFAESAPLTVDEFQTFNLCRDEAITGAVTAYSFRRECAVADEGIERFGVMAHEMRNLLNSAILSFALIKRGAVGAGGSTSAIHDRSLMRLNTLIARSLASVRIDAGIHTLERIPVCQVIEEAAVGGSLVAETRAVQFVVKSVDETVIVEVDRQILAAAVANLLQNAFKFTRPGTTVCLRASATTDRVLIEVEDECGGLPENPENLLRPFTQQGADRTGLGLGLSICSKAVKAMAGDLRVRDLPGRGCVFTIDLPKQPAPPTSIHARWQPETLQPPSGAFERARGTRTHHSGR